jgi:hypothetical protein
MPDNRSMSGGGNRVVVFLLGWHRGRKAKRCTDMEY